MKITDQGCDCTLYQHQNEMACTKTVIRCNGRWKWHRENDAKFCKVWGLPPPKNAAEAHARRGGDGK